MGKPDQPNLTDTARRTAELWPDATERGVSEPQLHVDVQGFEGPLDLLLNLARNQKVDLAHISVLELVDQYLVFIEDLKRMRLELAADYLVMAAWLAYLKSRLLLPPPEDEEEGPSGEEMARILAFRLQRLEAMRDKAALLMNRNRLGRDFFAVGAPAPIVTDRRREYAATLYEFLDAYANARQRTAEFVHAVSQREVWSLTQAREILERLLGTSYEWSSLDAFILQYAPAQHLRRSALASAFAASLEMVREGALEMRQEAPFAQLNVRASEHAASAIRT